MAGTFALLPVPGWLIGAPYIESGLAVDTPRGAWAAVLFLSLLAVLALGCAIPFRGADRTPDRPGPRLLLAGAVCGLAWAAGMRGFVMQVDGADPSFGWIGTFGVLLPAGAVVGGLLGRAEQVRRLGGSPRYALSDRESRWARWAAVPLSVVAVFLLQDISTLSTPRGAWTAVLFLSCLGVLTIACTIPRRS